MARSTWLRYRGQVSSEVMKRLPAVLSAATLMFAVAACATPAEDKTVTSSSSSTPSISAAPSTPVATTTTTTTDVAPPPDTAAPEIVPETIVPETEAPAATGNDLPPEWDKDGDGLIDTDAPVGDTDEAMCNDPNLAEWAATSPTCQ